MAGLIPLDRIVRDICEELGDTDYKLYMPVLRNVVLGYKDLHLHVIPHLSELSVKTEEFPLDGTRSVTLPEDFVYPVKVGLCVGGRICVIHLDNSLCLDREPKNNCPCETKEQAAVQIEDILAGRAIYGNWYNFHSGLGELYGVGGTYSLFGFYRYDKTAGRISFDTTFQIPENTKLIIEYKSDGVSDGLKYIPTEAELAVREFALSRIHATKGNGQLAIYCRQRYEAEYKRLKKLYTHWGVDEWRQMLLRNVVSAPKR